MMTTTITGENITAHELVGLYCSVVQSSDPTLMKIRGRMVYETKHLLVLDVDGNLKKVPKGVVTLSITLPDGDSCVVHGGDLLGRPESRIEKKRARR